MSADHSSILVEVESDLDKLSWPVLLLAGGVAGIGLSNHWTADQDTEWPL